MVYGLRSALLSREKTCFCRSFLTCPREFEPLTFVLAMTRTGVLLIRAWKEDADDSLRARVTAVADVRTCAPLELVIGTAPELHRALDDWLETLEPRSSRGPAAFDAPREPGRMSVRRPKTAADARRQRAHDPAPSPPDRSRAASPRSPLPPLVPTDGAVALGGPRVLSQQQNGARLEGTAPTARKQSPRTQSDRKSVSCTRTAH